MKILIAGASGATGKLLTEELLNRGHDVIVIIRSKERFPENLRDHPQITIVEAPLLNLSDQELKEYVKGCDAVASCLGHNLNLKGMYGQPRKLVTDAAKRLCGAIRANQPDTAIKYVLMNTSGNSNRDINEPISTGEKIVIGLLRLLVPPHVDNEAAADYLRVNIGQQDKEIEWCAVRPDGLINEQQVTEYTAYPSPIRSAIFSSGKISRINVAHFMADLITEQSLWDTWKGQMPVIYNK